ncbi:MAG: 2-amino-4-hydroxy-6-hydroxymethyldihydropteridine diphosphokinase [Planctomycetes bacterium]|nr:2-amino-4-hydroxy-6-hydroxymethyldihydropteridine diphosphokinase [Planctomycetota bacterium]
MTRGGIFIALGSNLGDRRANLEAAVSAIGALSGYSVLKRSRWIETDPVGGPPQGRFLNGVIEIDTPDSPRACLNRLLEIEQALGRVRRERWGPRTIDLDILLWRNESIEEEGLRVPHPRMTERAFVLEPLAEVLPGVAG